MTPTPPGGDEPAQRVPSSSTPHQPTPPWRRRLALLLAAAATAAVVPFATGGTAAAAPEPAKQADTPRVERGGIAVAPAWLDRVGVKTAPAERKPVVPTLRLTGSATFDPVHTASIGTRIRGLVRQVQLYEGDEVDQGDLLCEIDSAELGEAQAGVTIAKAHLVAADANLARELDLAGSQLTTARQAEVARATQAEMRAMLEAAQQRVLAMGSEPDAPLGVLRLRAPMSGTVIERHVAQGQSVEGHAIAFRVADLSHLWVELAVYERDVASIRVGDAVEIAPLANDEVTIRGKVAHVGSTIDEQTRSAEVRVEVDNSLRLLRPGQSVVATIALTGPRPDGVVVPRRAVTFVDGHSTVFVRSAPAQIVPVRVDLGATDGEAQEIRSGLAVGDQVVTDGVFALKSELFR